MHRRASPPIAAPTRPINAVRTLRVCCVCEPQTSRFLLLLEEVGAEPRIGAAGPMFRALLSCVLPLTSANMEPPAWRVEGTPLGTRSRLVTSSDLGDLDQRPDGRNSAVFPSGSFKILSNIHPSFICGPTWRRRCAAPSGRSDLQRIQGQNPEDPVASQMEHFHSAHSDVVRLYCFSQRHIPPPPAQSRCHQRKTRPRAEICATGMLTGRKLRTKATNQNGEPENGTKSECGGIVRS